MTFPDRKMATPFVSRVTKAFVLLVALLLPLQGTSHDIPTSVVVQSILKVDSENLDLLVRVPLNAMRDVNFPMTGPGYLVISQADETLFDAATIWIAQEVDLFEDGRQLDDRRIVETRVSLPSDRSFDSLATAIEHLNSPDLSDDEELMRDQALLDVWIRYPIDDAGADFAINPRFARLGLDTTTVLRFVSPGNDERVFRFTGNPGKVQLDPRWHHAFARFVVSGFEHILDGTDHLLFLLCLIIPFRRIRPLIVIVTSFTVAHSITLMAAAFGMVPNVLWFPPLVEALIAASIVYMALENIVGSAWRRRWLIAFGFGLIHGFGFSFALSEILQFAGGHLVTSLLAFNIGVEIGQILVVLIAVPILNLLFKHVIRERVGTIVLSALIAHTAWHWLSERATILSAFDFRTASWSGAMAIRWLILAIVVGVALWLLTLVYRRVSTNDCT